MTNNLRLVIIGLISMVLLIVVILGAIAIAQVVRGDAVDLPTALIGLIGTPIGALVGVLVPTQLTGDSAIAKPQRTPQQP